MKKSLIALAVAGAVSAPAFAATSNVDVYGRMHMAVSAFSDEPASVESLQISSNASRVGVKGTEDLGGGLAAIWQVETGINLDEQTGTWASRNSFVGLKGGFGTVLLGNHDTPLKLVGRSLDLFGDTIADSRNVMGGGSDTRARNVAAYISPSFSGFSIAAAYSNDVANGGGNGGDVVDTSAWNVSGTYANGPLYLGLAAGNGDFHEANNLGVHWRLGGGYSFGNFKVVAQYDQLNGDSSADPDYDAWMVGGAYTMGNIVLKANYMDGDVEGSSNDPKQWTVGVDYNLSKRTTIYGLYANGEFVQLGGGAGASDRINPAVDDISAFSIGVAHSF